MLIFKPQESLFDWQEIVWVFLETAVQTCLCFILLPWIGYKAIGMLYLLSLNFAALFVKQTTIMVSAVLSGVLWSYLFIPPSFAFIGASADDWMMLGLYLIVALVTGTLTTKLRAKEKILQIREERATALYLLTKEISSSHELQDVIACSVQIIERLFQAKAGICLSSGSSTAVVISYAGGNLHFNAAELAVASWVATYGKPAGRFTGMFSDSAIYYLPLQTGTNVIGVMGLELLKTDRFNNDQQTLLETFATQLALGIEREKLHESLRKSLVLKESERIYTTLLHSVSHELKTPLAAIKGCATALLDKEVLKNSKVIPELAQEIYIGSERMQDMIQNLLDMNRIESQKVKMHLEPCDIRDVLAMAVQRLGKLLKEREVKLTTAPDLPLIFIDYVLVEQAIRNILHNACIYTPAGTGIEIDASLENQSLQISIRDHGPGLPKENPQQVFEKFSRARDAKPSGTGLGLFISKAFIELHHGQIEAENHPTGGAYFKIRLPLQPENLTEMAPNKQVL